MLRVIASINLMLIISGVQAQDAVWGKFFDSEKGSISIETSTTPSGEILLFGYYNGELPVGNEVLIPKYNDSGSYIIKLDPDGTVILAIPIDGKSVIIENAAVDSNGNIIVEGRFFESIFFDGQEYTDQSAGDAKSSFVAKLSPTGDHLWIRTFSNSAYGNMVLDETNEIYFLSVEILNFNNTSSFLRKFDSNGNLIFENQFLAFNEAESYPRTLDVRNGEVIAGGMVYGSGTVFNSISYSGFGWGFYVAKFNADGTLNWAQSLGETVYNNPDISDIMIDDDGGFLISGGLANNTLLAKYNSSGILEWTKKSLPQRFSSSYMCKTLDGKYFLAANFYHGAEIDGHPLDATPDSNLVVNSPNIVVLEFDQAGNILGFQQFKPHIINFATSITAGLFNDLYISGDSSAPILEVGNIQMTAPNDTEENDLDGFIVKFSDQSIGYETFDIVASDLCIKENGTFTVTADVAEIKNISWDFGDPTSGTLNSSASLSPSHSYNVAGVYKTRATITDFSNNISVATIIFEVHDPPSISLGDDFGLCLGQEKRIELPSNAEWTYVWQDGSTDYFNDVRQSGKYWVSVNDLYCVVTDTVSVTQLYLAEFKLTDHALCAGEELVVDLRHLDASISWTDGATNKIRNISSTGTYEATATNSCGSYSQSFIITVIQPLNVAVEDEVICKGQSYKVDLSEIDATLSWNDSDTAHIKYFESAGSYSVKISNQCEQKSLSFNVSETPPLKVDLGKDKATCNPSEPTTFATVQGSANYLWSNGSTQSSITVYEAGVYWVDVTNSCETVRDSVAVTHVDQAEIFIPNIITPNGDTRNEVFTIDERIKGSSLLVFNRWGQNVYSTNSYNNDWSADNLETGVYYYTIPEYCLKGWIHVLRE
jgi:hypothetical protein